MSNEEYGTGLLYEVIRKRLTSDNFRNETGPLVVAIFHPWNFAARADVGLQGTRHQEQASESCNPTISA